MTGHLRESTLLNLFDGLPQLGDRPAIGVRREYGVRWWSYARLHRRSREAALRLSAAGVGPGDRVVLWGASTPEWVGFFFGVVLRNAVVVPVDDGAPVETVGRMAREVDARLLVAVRGRELPAGIPSIAFEELREDGDPAIEPLPVKPNDPAVIFFTSGTTSKPRGVILSHANLMSQVTRFAKWRWLVRMIPFRIMVSAPLTHVQGLMLGICVPLQVGLSAIYAHFHHPDHLIRTIRDNRVTLMSTVPRVLQTLARAIENRPYGRSREPLKDWLARTRSVVLRRHRIFNGIRPLVGYRFWIVIVGGVRLPGEIEDFWRHTGCLLVQGYGLTETAAIISVNAPIFGRFGSVGKPLGHQDVRIAEDGEILVRGPNVTPGYYGEVAGKAPVSEDGYLKTGDLGRFDSRRRLFFQGRKKDVIVTGEGFNVYGGDVERVLDEEPGVRGSVVLGLERSGNTEVHAALLLEESASPSDIVQNANRKLAPHERVRGWTRWPERDFPRGQLLKVRRDKVASLVGRFHAQVEAPAPSGPVTLETIYSTEDHSERLRLLADYLATSSHGDTTDLRTNMVRDLGLSSLDVIELLFHLESRSQRLLDHIVVEETTTLAELRSLFQNPDEARPTKALYSRKPPRWAELGPLVLLRRVLNPLVLLPWTAARARLSVLGLEHLERLECPCLFECTGHEHGSDVLTLFSALPPRLRRRLGFVGQRWVFSFYLDPPPGTSFAARAAVGFGFHAAVPLFFPFALVSHFGAARDGLTQACRLIDRGFSLIIFEGKGIDVIAEQTGVPVVPVHLSGNEGGGYLPTWPRPTIEVTFERTRPAKR